MLTCECTFETKTSLSYLCDVGRPLWLAAIGAHTDFLLDPTSETAAADREAGMAVQEHLRILRPVAGAGGR